MAAALANIYVPDFELSMDGQPLPADLRASTLSVRFDESLEGADRVEVQLANQGLRLLGNPLLQLKTSLELSLGYRPQGVVPVFKGELTGIDPVFPSSGMPTVTVSAHDFMSRLMEGSKERAFPWYLPDSVIATIVAGENFLITEPDPAAAIVGSLNLFNQRPRYQYKQSDYKFLRQIASEYGFEMWVDGDFMNFKFLLPQLPPSEVELRWGESLIDFSPKHTSIGEVASVTLKVYIQELKTELAIQAKWEDDSLGISVTPALFAEQAKAVETSWSLPDVPLDTPVDAIKWVLSEMRRRINNRTTGKGTAIGDPRLRIGQVVTLSGLGDEFSSNSYRLTSVSHGIDRSGYRTSFEVRKELV